MPHRVPDNTNGVPLIKSKLLEKIDGLDHAFPCKSGAPDEDVEAMAARLVAAFGINAILMAKQVHGVDVLHFDGVAKDALKLRETEADCAMTKTPLIAAAARTADCVPILIADPKNRAVAAIHGGWRGIVAGVVEAAVLKMTEVYKSKPRELVAAIGPHIRKCCFEVGPEVAEIFGSKFGSALVSPGKKDRSYVDLATASRISLERAGLAAVYIDDVNACTACNPDLFFSYRRDGQNTGRQINIIFYR